MADANVPPSSGSPEELAAAYDRMLKEAAESLPALGLELRASLFTVPKRPQQAVPLLRGFLESLRDRVLELLRKLDALLGPRPDDDEDGGAGDDLRLLEQMLEECRRALAAARQKLFEAEQDRDLARAALAERERHIAGQQALIDDLQKRVGDLEALLRDLGQRRPVDPAALGSALGGAVDAIQEGLTSLRNPLIDYGLQEFDLETQVNVEVDADGRLQVRFPGFNEAVNAQSLSRLCLRLRPIPKAQDEGSPATATTTAAGG